MAEAVDSIWNGQDSGRRRDPVDRLSRRAVSLEKDIAILTDRVNEVRLELARGLAMVALEGRLQQITDIVSTLQSNAYGEQGSVLSTTNLLLAGNQLFWTLLDPVLKEAGMIGKSGSSTLALLTPVGSFMTGELLVANRQHERFISGVSEIGANDEALATLRSRIASGEWDKFQRRGDVPFTLQVLDGNPAYRVRGDIRDGVLRIRLFSIPRLPTAGVRVAWIVDTGIGHG